MVYLEFQTDKNKSELTPCSQNVKALASNEEPNPLKTYFAQQVEEFKLNP